MNRKGIKGKGKEEENKGVRMKGRYEEERRRDQRAEETENSRV